MHAYYKKYLLFVICVENDTELANYPHFARSSIVPFRHLLQKCTRYFGKKK